MKGQTHEEILESKDFKRGDQVAYIPGHAQDINSPDAEFGFVTSTDSEHVFARYWHKGMPHGRLRTVANSERTPMRRLIHFDYIDQAIVDELLSRLAQQEKRVEKTVVAQ